MISNIVMRGALIANNSHLRNRKIPAPPAKNTGAVALETKAGDAAFPDGGLWGLLGQPAATGGKGMPATSVLAGAGIPEPFRSEDEAQIKKAVSRCD